MRILFMSLAALISTQVLADHVPVVFVHGMGADPAQYDTPDLHKVFNDAGHPLLITRNRTRGPIATRAAELAKELTRIIPDGPFHIVAHSMGGLESRLAIHQYGFGSRVLSLTTIGTPHHGTPVADLARGKDHYPDGSWQDKAIKSATSLFGSDPDGVADLTSKKMDNVFNPVVKDDPRVRYFSMTFFIPSPAILYTSERRILEAHAAIGLSSDYKKDDGLVPTPSQVWGEVIDEEPCDHRTETQKGTFRGCDHLKVFSKALANLNRVFP